MEIGMAGCLDMTISLQELENENRMRTHNQIIQTCWDSYLHNQWSLGISSNYFLTQLLGMLQHEYDKNYTR